MALRELVTGGATCAAPSSSSSNPLGNLVDSLLGSQSKNQERLRELPGLADSSHIAQDIGTSGPLTYLPGSELEQENGQQSGQVSDFMQGFHGIDHSGFADAWNDVSRVPGPPPIFQESRGDPSHFSEFEQIYTDGRETTMQPMPGNGTPQRVLSGFLSSFVGSARDAVQFHPVHLPELGLSAADKCRIRDRCSIMARQFFADKGDVYVNDQVNALLHSLDIESDLRVWGPQGDRSAELDQYWNQSPAESNFVSRGGAETSNNWVTQFAQHPSFKEGAENWVNEFQHSVGGGWVDQFGKEQAQLAARSIVQNGDFNNMAALDQTRSLVETLSQNKDPKFQNSKFLQFVSKMSRGELIVEDNKVKPHEGFDSQASGDVWAAEFTAGEHIHQGDDWVKEFRQNKNLETSTSEGWINEFSNLNMNSWADEYDEQSANGTIADDSTSGWVDSYEKYVEEQLKGEQKRPPSSRWLYQFADQNPYVGHPNPLKEGQDLFRQGLLSEAVLALEAEVLKNPDNAEGWRLLGITHAENDDDRQAIASMVRARDADPANLEVLLSLGVSHTNELEQREALTYLQGWLQNHPKYGMLVQQSQQESLSHSEVTKCFLEAAQICPEDPDVHTVLGVLYNLSREYDSAIEAFQSALKLKPRDYSLWNKLGATQANSARSANAIHAYQEALDLKPNYVRAWSNMGISYANQGLYKESLSYYVRALCMNPKADNAWQYLRISLSILGRSDMLDACNRQDLDLLQKEFPL